MSSLIDKMCLVDWHIFVATDLGKKKCIRKLLNLHKNVNESVRIKFIFMTSERGLPSCVHFFKKDILKIWNYAYIVAVGFQFLGDETEFLWIICKLVLIRFMNSKKQIKLSYSLIFPNISKKQSTASKSYFISNPQPFKVSLTENRRPVVSDIS